MSRRNPKKDKSARRRRPSRPVGTGRFRMDIDDLGEAILHAPADIAPILALTGAWMWNAAQDAISAAHCIDACLTLHHALGVYGIDSHLEPVTLAISGNGSSTLYGGDGPHWNPNGSFNGHVVLAIPEAGRFVDATIQQYREVPVSTHGNVPIIARLPNDTGLGVQPFGVSRGDHQVVYAPVPPEQREAWRHPRIAAQDAAYRNAGANLAGNVFDMLRIADLRDKIRQSPYPRLRHLLDVLGDAETVVGPGLYGFRRRGDGTVVTLSDIP
ncbi:hypothetical protein [Streptosporangium sandarakinum]|uniref:hypothetical protein n=1 Tax=Streptosporangium sandarakinum TaxID=1260955 RepID=UPI0036A554E4